MADLIQLAITTYDAHGKPFPGGDDQLVNLDQVDHIEQHLGNNLFRRHRLGGTMPAEHYPCLQLTMHSGRKYLASLGTFPTAEAGLAALEAFMPALLGSRGTLSDADEKRLLGQ